LITGKRIWQIIRNVFLIFLGLFLAFMLILVPWFGTFIVTTSRFHFPDPNDGKTPKSYGMDFQWIYFHSSDGIPLSGWYVPAGADARGTIVYCHGQNRTRIEMLPMAAFAHALGYNGLLFDLRHSGLSGGRMGTLGYKERLDAEAAVRYALDEEKAPHPLVLWGISMGAAAALMAASETPAVDGVISDSSFLSFRHVIVHHARLFFHLPSFPISDEVIYWSAWRGGFRPSDFDLRKAVQKINPRPILFIAVEGDRRILPSTAKELDSLSDSPRKMLIVVPGHRHGEGWNSGHEQYVDAVKNFLTNLHQ
jgi:uncharacterized protein